MWGVWNNVIILLQSWSNVEFLWNRGAFSSKRTVLFCTLTRNPQAIHPFPSISCCLRADCFPEVIFANQQVWYIQGWCIYVWWILLDPQKPQVLHSDLDQEPQRICILYNIVYNSTRLPSSRWLVVAGWVSIMFWCFPSHILHKALPIRANGAGNTSQATSAFSRSTTQTLVRYWYPKLTLLVGLMKPASV